MEEQIFIDMTKISYIGKFEWIIDGVKLPYTQDLTKEGLLKVREEYVKQQEDKR